MKKSKKKEKTNILVGLMIACVVLSLTMLAIVAYDKLIKQSCAPCSCNQSTVSE